MAAPSPAGDPGSPPRARARPVGSSAASHSFLFAYLTANITSTGLFGVALIAIRLFVVRSNWVTVDAVGVSLAACLLAVVRLLLRTGRIDAALSLHAATIWGVSVLTVAITPFVLAPVALTLLLPVVVSVPYLNQRRMRATIAGAMLTAGLCAVAAWWRPVTSVEASAPSWLRTSLLVGTIPLVAGYLALLLWQAHVDLLRHADELRESRARLVESGDAARRRLERDLHDGAQQRLAAVAIQVALAKRVVDCQATTASMLLDGIEHELSEAIADLRTLAHGLYPPLLAQRGLGEALRAAAVRSPIPVHVDADDIGRHSPEVEAATYFTCLEALTNAAKHGDGGSASVTVRHDRPRHRLMIEVSDDGHGFDPTATEPGLGLVSMTDRLGAVGGELTIASRPGGGTRVCGVIPLPSASGGSPSDP